MYFQDLLITPIYGLLLLLLAYLIRPYFTTRLTRQYFLPALMIKFVGAIVLGLVYQFYYGDGDTLNYTFRGSYWVWQAFLDDPILAFKLIFGDMDLSSDVYPYASRIYTYGDSASYAVVRVAGFFSLITFNFYGASALLFATLSFTGIWLIFISFQKMFPQHTKKLAFGILFLPSLFFWGSGILKDSITLAAVGWVFWSVMQIAMYNRKYITGAILILVGFYTLYVIKIYILLCLLPPIAFWLYSAYKSKVRNVVIRWMLAPVLLVTFAGAGYYSVLNIGAGSSRYSVDEVLYTAEQTAKWNHYVSERNQGSAYSLGNFDFGPSALAMKFVPAVLTSFFRPMLFEISNPLMLLSAVENTLILFLFLKAMGKPRRLRQYLGSPVLVFSIIFSVLFAFAVGVTTYNFGSLVRYKIPMLPFLMAFTLIVSSREARA